MRATPYTPQELAELSSNEVIAIARRAAPLTPSDLMNCSTPFLLATIVYQNWLILSKMKENALGDAVGEPETDL